MADWYVSSAAYSAIPTFQTSHAYLVGDIIRPTAPQAYSQYPQRCTTAGTSAGSEPGWQTSDNAATGTGTAVFTCVGGQSTYGWSAAIGTLPSLSANLGAKNAVAGDRVFVSSDHSESNVSSSYQLGTTAGHNGIKFISVNRAGSVPPVAADVTPGAAISTNQSLFTIDNWCPLFWDGFTFNFTNGSSCAVVYGASSSKSQYYKNCAHVVTALGVFESNNITMKVVWDNTTLQVGNSSSIIRGCNNNFDFTWINTPSAIVGGTVPSFLFGATSGVASFLATCRGVDLSAITGTLVGASNIQGVKVLFDSCKIASGVTRYSTPGVNTCTFDEVELVNCYDGTNIFSERYTPGGIVTTDTSTYLTGGAADDVGHFSHKMVSNSQCELYSDTCDGFWFDVENTSIGSSKTATVEIVSSASLNNNDIKLQLEYMGTSSSSLASFAESLVNSLTATAVTTSTATWNSPPSTPVYQKLQVTFTPQKTGRVRGRIQLGKTSKTVWVNPQITIA